MIKPTETPEITEPEQQVSVPEASVKQPEEPVTVTPPEIPDLSIGGTAISPSTSAPSCLSKPSEPQDDDVLIIGTGFIEPGNPIALAKHTAKQEVIERRKQKFDISHYSQLSSNEILSGYLSQVHTSRDLEIDMVKQMHQKYEV